MKYYDWSRVRTITANFRGPYYDEARLIDLVYGEIATGIIEKLREHHKFEKIDLGNGLIHVRCSLDIIVPYPTSSNRTVPSARSSE